MASQYSARAAQFGSAEPGPGGFHPAPAKLDRLRELRATIDGLRSEREQRDPLLAWILERENSQSI